MHYVWRALTAIVLLSLLSACAAPAPSVAPSATPFEPAIAVATARETEGPPLANPITSPSPVVSTQTATAVATATPPPTPGATDTPAPRPTAQPTRSTPEAIQRNSFFKLIEPLISQARAERSKNSASDPDYYMRIDVRLNEDRINILAVGYGITFEPPWPPDKMGSITIFSINLRTGRIDQVTINHDVRAPEIERHLQAGNPAELKKAHKIDKGLFVGGTSLLKQIVEDVTGHLGRTPIVRVGMCAQSHQRLGRVADELRDQHAGGLADLVAGQARHRGPRLAIRLAHICAHLLRQPLPQLHLS